MHHSVWKIGQSSRVIHVQMRDHDVTNILRMKSDTFDLCVGCLVGIEDRAQHSSINSTQTAGGMSDILATKSCINENQAFRRLNQETMADEFTGEISRLIPGEPSAKGWT